MKQKLWAEALGSFLLFATVIGSGIMAERLAGGNMAVALLGNTAATAAMLYVLIAIKTLWDLASSTTSAKAADLPAQPPAWARKLADSVGKDRGGAAKMSADWQRNTEQMKHAAIEDEQVMPG